MKINPLRERNNPIYKIIDDREYRSHFIRGVFFIIWVIFLLWFAWKNRLT
jgi:hypothetical protein